MVLQHRQADQTQTTRFLDKLELLEFRLDRLFRKSQDSHSLSVSLGCLQESFRVLALPQRIRHALNEHL